MADIDPERSEPAPVDEETPEADRLEQLRPELDEDLDPEAPAGTGVPAPLTAEADEADVLEQSIEVPDDGPDVMDDEEPLD